MEIYKNVSPKDPQNLSNGKVTHPNKIAKSTKGIIMIEDAKSKKSRPRSKNGSTKKPLGKVGDSMCVIDSTDSEKESSPYKSPTVLSFDAYGNLTSSDDPDAPYSHEVPSLAEFDYILGSFEGRFQKETETDVPLNKNGAIKKNKTKNVKHISSSSETEPISDKELNQLFKKDFDSSAIVTTRYGRTRKQKADDGFLFGTINFNELRKITSGGNSPKKARHSSASETKSDSETNGDTDSNVTQALKPLTDKVIGYSSEDEFVIEDKSKKNVKSKRRKTMPASVTELTKTSPKEKLAKKSTKKSKKSSIEDKRSTSSSTDDLQKEDNDRNLNASLSDFPKHSDDDFDTKFSEKLLDSLSKENSNVKKIVEKSNFNVRKTDLEEIESIEEDVNIIKISLGLMGSDPKIVTPSEVIPEVVLEESNDVDILYESAISNEEDKGEKNKVSEKETDPKVIEMEALTEECKPMEALTEECKPMEALTEECKPMEAITTKSGRQSKKPNTLVISSDVEKKHKGSEIGTKKDITEEILLNHTSNADSHLEKEFPCTQFIGDVVWVCLKGNPFWPGMITYPKNETTHTRVLAKRREYHVQFFFDNYQTVWSSASAFLPYKGLNDLMAFIENVKETAKVKKKCHRSLIARTCQRMAFFLQKGKNSQGKTYNWYKAVEEADHACTLDRYERIKIFKPAGKKPQSPARANSENTKKRKSVSTKTSPKSEMYPDKSKSSSDEFSGFDEDSQNGLRKMKRIKLEEKVRGDFEVYLQKHLFSTMEDSNLAEEKARSILSDRWKKLTAAQRSRYKSKISYEPSSLDTDDSSSELSSLSSSKSKKSSVCDDDGLEPSKGTYRITKHEKVCFHCEDVSLQSGTDMIKCKGACSSIFHLKCIGLDATPTIDFKCAACLSGVHACFICKSEDGEKIKCSVNSCGKFYHEACVRKWPQVQKGRQTEKLVCPRHVCHMCAANADDMNDPAARSPPFTRCLRCPTTYHTGETCIAAGVEEISQNYHVCTKHMKMPKHSSHHFNVNWCFCCSKGGSLLLCDQCPAAFHAECMNITAPEGGYICEDCENGKFPVYGDIVWVKLGSYRWWPGEVLHSRFIPDNIENLNHVQGMFCVHFFGSDDYYWMSRGRTFHYQEGDQGSKSNSNKFLEQKFQKALEEAVVAYRNHKEKRDRQEESRSLKGNLKPPPYVRIDTNKPVGNVRLGKLDPSTITRCDCDPYSESPCSSDDKCINRMLMVECIREICPAKERCNNQRFQRRQYPNVVPFKTTGRGWGLKTKDFIKKGEFVIEYVGELIDDAEFRRRIDEMHDYKEQNYYFLTVETDRLIDAGPKGNLARFMNHSCQPNCETQKWTVGADTRVGLFALEDIPEGSELTFNYNLECVGTEKKKCNCGADNCSGFIGVKVQKPESSTVKKPKLENGLKKKKGRKRKLEKETDDECFRCGSPGDLILCDISSCPKGYHLKCLGLQELPKGKWLCPWHHCDDCGFRSSNRCVVCPNSFCRSHSGGKFHAAPGLGNVCLEHKMEDFKAGSDESGSDSSPSSRECSPEVLT